MKIPTSGSLLPQRPVCCWVLFSLSCSRVFYYASGYFYPLGLRLVGQSSQPPITTGSVAFVSPLYFSIVVFQQGVTRVSPGHTTSYPTVSNERLGTTHKTPVKLLARAWHIAYALHTQLKREDFNAHVRWPAQRGSWPPLLPCHRT